MPQEPKIGLGPRLSPQRGGAREFTGEPPLVDDFYPDPLEGEDAPREVQDRPVAADAGDILNAIPSNLRRLIQARDKRLMAFLRYVDNLFAENQAITVRLRVGDIGVGIQVYDSFEDEGQDAIILLASDDMELELPLGSSVEFSLRGKNIQASFGGDVPFFRGLPFRPMLFFPKPAS